LAQEKPEPYVVQLGGKTIVFNTKEDWCELMWPTTIAAVQRNDEFMHREFGIPIPQRRFNKMVAAGDKASPPKPMSYRDPRTGVFLYVESDGRHLAAIGPDGALLWVRNPFEDAKLCVYRTPRPIIDSIAEADVSKDPKFDPADKYVAIAFDSSQFGLVSEKTGDFTFEGQN
jgi:hypothetical protein